MAHFDPKAEVPARQAGFMSFSQKHAMNGQREGWLMFAYGTKRTQATDPILVRSRQQSVRADRQPVSTNDPFRTSTSCSGEYCSTQPIPAAEPCEGRCPRHGLLAYNLRARVFRGVSHGDRE